MGNHVLRCEVAELVHFEQWLCLFCCPLCLTLLYIVYSCLSGSLSSHAASSPSLPDTSGCLHPLPVAFVCTSLIGLVIFIAIVRDKRVCQDFLEGRTSSLYPWHLAYCQTYSSCLIIIFGMNG